MSLPSILNSPSTKQGYILAILESNEKTKKHGLVLTSNEVSKIIEVRNNVLHSYGRIELSIEVTKTLIEKFSTSTYINSENYVNIINELQEIFYYLKNETEDKIPDSKLQDTIKDFFENQCGGSIELLKSKLELFARDFRRQIQIEEL